MGEFPATHADLLDAPFATLGTIDSDGRPQLTEVWFLHEDGELKLWLNGELVYTMNAQRGYKLSDTATVRLKAGVNRIVVKVSQADGGWGWGVAVPKALF